MTPSFLTRLSSDLLLVVGVDVAERPVEANGVAGRREVLRQPGRAFELDPLEARLAGIGGDADEGLLPVDHRADRSRHLHVLIVGVEGGEAYIEAAVEEARLPADLVAVDSLGFSSEERLVGKESVSTCRS